MTTYATPDRDGSDVHVIAANGWLRCLDCSISPEQSTKQAYVTPTTDIPAMLDHLDIHTLAGHHIPPQTFIQLRRDHSDQFEKGPR